MAELKQPLHEADIKQRPADGKSGNMIDYIEWHTAADYLDRYAPGWTKEVKDVRLAGEWVLVTVRVTIPTQTGPFFKEATGNERLDMRGYGDPFSNAEAMAFKRAAAYFGLARYLYQKEGGHSYTGNYGSNEQRQGYQQGRPERPRGDFRPTPVSEVRDPIAKNLQDLVTAKQLGMIRAMAREMRINADEECISVLNCRTDELSKKAAGSFIDHLKELQNPSDVEHPRQHRDEFQNPPPTPPQMMSRPDRATPAQLGALSKIAAESRMTIEELASQEFENFQDGASSLSKAQASQLIKTYGAKRQ